MYTSRENRFKDRRFRKARHVNDWFSFDHLVIGDTKVPFEHGDVVEFMDPVFNKLVHREVKLSYQSHMTRDGFALTRTEHHHAFVRVGRKMTRILEAPAVRFVEKEEK